MFNEAVVRSGRLSNLGSIDSDVAIHPENLFFADKVVVLLSLFRTRNQHTKLRGLSIYAPSAPERNVVNCQQRDDCRYQQEKQVRIL